MFFDPGSYDHHIFAALALIGTVAAAIGLLWIARKSRWAATIKTYRGISPTFLNVLGVMFALNLVFLANDTWHAQDRAIDAVYQEASALGSLRVLAGQLPESQRTKVVDAVRTYAAAAAGADWPALARRQSSPEAAARLDQLLLLVTSPEVGQAVDHDVHVQLIQQAQQVRLNRVTRIAVSQTHVNPLKWLGMAFLGFLIMVSIVLVHVDVELAEAVAVLLFAAASAPTAAIVLVQGNPFQPPLMVSPAPIEAQAAP